MIVYHVHCLYIFAEIKSLLTVMADNYLERQREQYEARKQAWERAKKLGKQKNPGLNKARVQRPERPDDEAL